MVQANKLAALGQITAGVAHEVNQPLAAIRLMAENGAALLPRDAAPEVAGNLSSILRMTDRIARITDQLRGFARKATGQVGPVSLKEAVDAALLLTASRRTAQRIALDLPAIDPGLRVMAETVRLEQILVNLLQNAQEALADTPDPRIALSVEPGPNSVRISLSDNGPGIAPEARAQLFTPFATSKPKGLGLGLVISQEIARDFGGSLRAGPATGQGASFVLELPRAA
ncbi:sensor histidine kinase [Paracoccus mutanolyticus]|uniref:sensor histidine kinase n=1 Tax=Paracoccus mutanolyticus TaxID=1499308 RepID=UPI001CB95971|nr:ATP-binding protein [Paracoccus mutanolyticus]